MDGIDANLIYLFYMMSQFERGLLMFYIMASETIAAVGRWLLAIGGLSALTIIAVCIANSSTRANRGYQLPGEY